MKHYRHKHNVDVGKEFKNCNTKGLFVTFKTENEWKFYYPIGPHPSKMPDAIRLVLTHTSLMLCWEFSHSTVAVSVPLVQ